MLRRRTKIKKSKRKLRPFRRVDEASMESGLSSYEKFILFMLFCKFLIIIVYGIGSII